MEESKTCAGQSPNWQTLKIIAGRLRGLLDPTASAREADAHSLAIQLDELAERYREDVSRSYADGRADERRRIQDMVSSGADNAAAVANRHAMHAEILRDIAAGLGCKP